MFRTLILATAILLSGVIAQADTQAEVDFGILDRLKRIEDIVLGQQRALDQQEGDLRQLRAEIWQLGNELAIIKQYGLR